MKKYQREFIEYIFKKQILKFIQVKLKSGRISPYFFNTSLFSTGQDIAFLGRIYAEALVNSGISFDLLFGPAYKGIPIVTTTAIALAEQYQWNISYCFNRKENKNYGEGGVLVGSHLYGKVMLVDDVITAGSAIRESMDIITAHKATVTGVMILLNRQEKGNGEISAIKEIERDYNCQVLAIITLADIISFIKKKKEMTKYLAAIIKYQQQYGVIN